LKTASGYFAATFSKTLAGPSGFRLPCSQFCNVETLIPSNLANLLCDKPSFSLIIFGSGLSKSYTRLAFLFPLRIFPPSLILFSNSINNSSFNEKTHPEDWHYSLNNLVVLLKPMLSFNEKTHPEDWHYSLNNLVVLLKPMFNI
jgi:hypothetical protein